jgi:predicted phage terminase large subunit-like protein
VIGLDPEDRMFLLDLWRGQKSPDVWIDAFCDLVLKWKPQGWAEEQGQIKSAIGPFLDKRISERRAYVTRAKFPTKGDKSIRAQSIRGRMAVKGLFVPTHADWYPDFRAELLGFPAAKHDDAADAIGLIGQIIDKMWKGSPLPAEKTKPKIISTDPSQCTVTLRDLFESNERRHRKRVRIY